MYKINDDKENRSKILVHDEPVPLRVLSRVPAPHPQSANEDPSSSFVTKIFILLQSLRGHLLHLQDLVLAVVVGGQLVKAVLKRKTKTKLKRVSGSFSQDTGTQLFRIPLLYLGT